MLKGELLEEKKEVAHLLADCVMACNHCFSSCLEEEDVQMMKDCIRQDKECAEICLFTIGMLHKSRFVDQYLALCIEACEACARECNKHPQDHCKHCAEVCRKCAEACRNFRQKFHK